MLPGRAPLAEAAGAADDLVAAALLHDVGHFTGEFSGHDLMARHRQPAQPRRRRLAGQWFAPAVTEPVRLHVAAKRYLCAVEPAYFASLSPASALHPRPCRAARWPRGGRRFEAQPDARRRRLRRWDDAAKDPDRVVPAFEDYTALLYQLIR